MSIEVRMILMDFQADCLPGVAWLQRTYSHDPGQTAAAS